MEYIIIDPKTATEEELYQATKENCRTAKMMREEIEKLKTIASEEDKRRENKINKGTRIKQKEELSKEVSTNIDQEFEDEVNYYFSSLNKLTSSNLSIEFESVLPSIKNYRYQDILYRLKAGIIRNIKEIKDCISEEGLTEENAQAFKDDLELEREKIRLLDEVINGKDKEELSEKNETSNIIIFSLTSGGNIRVLEEIEGITPEYYEQFYILLQSIKDGTFKNIRKFNNNKDITGLSEVRLNQARIIFDHLDKDSYAVITAFVKKTNNDRYYQTAIRQKACDYYAQKEMIIKNLSNPEFLEHHALYEQELFNKITPSHIQTKPVVKQKGGE